MDIVGDVLSALRIRGSLYFHTDFGGGWGVRVPSFEQVARFHIAMQGEFWVALPGSDASAHIREGDVALVPHGAEHILSAGEKGRAETLDAVLEKSGFSGAGALVYHPDGDAGLPARQARMVCGHFSFDNRIRHPLVDELPKLIVLRSDRTQNFQWLDRVIQFIAHESASELPGGEAVTNRLSEILFVQALRVQLASAAPEQRFLLALADTNIRRALEAIHADPTHGWTVAELATRAAMSRTIFAERFVKSVGMTPAAYLRNWRIQIAIRQLRDTSAQVEDIAAEVGYGSGRALARALVQETGYRLSEFRAG